MKSLDLRDLCVGCWLMGPNNEPFEVLGYDINTVKYTLDYDWYRLSECRGIILTQEVLEACGFKNAQTSFPQMFLSEDKVTVYLDGLHNSYGHVIHIQNDDGNLIHIDHVFTGEVLLHELQLLLRGFKIYLRIDPVKLKKYYS